MANLSDKTHAAVQRKHLNRHGGITEEQLRRVKRWPVGRGPMRDGPLTCAASGLKKTVGPR